MIYYNMKYIIYKIQIKDYIYIGSTTNFTIRKSKHKWNCNNGNNLLVYRTIREHGNWDSCTMVPVKEIEVENKTQAHIAEEAVRVEYNAQMNMVRAYRTEDERKEADIESKRHWQQSDTGKEYQRKYQQTDAAREYQRQYRLAKKAKKDLAVFSSASIV